MDELKDIRWMQRFSNFEKSYKLLAKYIYQPINTELERAGIIQLFEVSFELSWKLMKDYLESQEIYAKSPRETIKQAYQIELIDGGHIWMDALLRIEISLLIPMMKKWQRKWLKISFRFIFQS